MKLTLEIPASEVTRIVRAYLKARFTEIRVESIEANKYGADHKAVLTDEPETEVPVDD